MTERWCRERKKKKFHDREDKGEREKIKEIVSSFFWSLKIDSKYEHTQEICVHFPLVPSLKMNHNSKWLSHN